MATWRQYFDMDPDVVGSTVPVGARREPFTVIGVMPPAFQFPSGAEVWTPVGRELAGIFRQNEMDAGVQRGLGVLYVIGRLVPGRTLAEGRAEMDVIVPGLWESHFSRWGTRRVVMTPLTDYVFGNAEAALFVLLGGVALLLLIACANVTGLLIVRSQSRRRDVAVQCALGIGRGRLFRAHLLETLLVSGAAAAGGNRTGVGGTPGPRRVGSRRHAQAGTSHDEWHVDQARRSAGACARTRDGRAGISAARPAVCRRMAARRCAWCDDRSS